MAEMTDEQKKLIWERGQHALAKILKYVSIDKVETLAAKVEQKEFRDSLQYKIFMRSL